MRCFRRAWLRDVCPGRFEPGRVLAVAKVVAAGFLVSACAASHAGYDRPSNVGMQAPQQVAIAVPKKIELEADGLAVQAPPRIRKRSEPDDPSEPFSPNYGPALLPSEPANVPLEPERKADAGAVILRSRTTPMSDREAQEIVVQAMVAHELRNP